MLNSILNFLTRRIKSTVSRNQIKVFSIKRLGINKKHLSRGAIDTIKKLQQNNFNALVVGGAVRDLLVGVKPKDFDVVTNAKPEQIKKIFRRSRIIGKRFKLVHVYVGDETIEVSTFRSKNSSNVMFDDNGRITRDNSFGERDEDANRRDLSINALYLDPFNDQVFDYHNGVNDIQSKIIRVIGSPAERYREDPVRMLRVLRFSAKLNFSIEYETYINIKKYSNLINGIPKSRLFDEVVKLLLSGNAMKGMEELWSTKLYLTAMPFLHDVFTSQYLNNSDFTVNNFLTLALNLVDKRVKTSKTVSIGFILACLFWHRLLKDWNVNRSRGLREIPALLDAINKIMDENFTSSPIQKRYLTDMKEIWILQPRFEKRRGKAPFRLIKNIKFRAALNFLKLQADIKMVRPELVTWWDDFFTQKDDGRLTLINSLSHPSPKNSKARRKKIEENRPI